MGGLRWSRGWTLTGGTERTHVSDPEPSNDAPGAVTTGLAAQRVSELRLRSGVL